MTLVCVWVFCLMYVCASCAWGDQRGQKWALEALELELPLLWTNTWLLGIEPGSSGRSVSVHDHWAISPPPPLLAFMNDNTNILAQVFIWMFSFMLNNTYENIHGVCLCSSSSHYIALYSRAPFTFIQQCKGSDFSTFCEHCFLSFLLYF